ncbi:MAG: YHS domain-containing protein [Planctomycetota bacterium]
MSRTYWGIGRIGVVGLSVLAAAFVLALTTILSGCGDGEQPAGTMPAPGAGAFVAETGQKTCPVMAGAISSEYYYDYEGRRIYFCCAECVDTFKEDPEKYIEKVDTEISGGEAVSEEAPEEGAAGESARPRGGRVPPAAVPDR